MPYDWYNNREIPAPEYDAYIAAAPKVGPTATNDYFAANPDVAASFAQNSYGLTPDQFAAAHYNLYGATEQRAAPEPAPAANQGLAENATTAKGLLSQYQSALTPEQYQQLIAPLMFTANDQFGGKLQDFQVQLITPLDTSKVGVPKQLSFTAEGTPTVPNVSGDSESGYRSTEPTMINGVPVFANYDASGKLTGYEGDNRVTTWLNNKDRLIGNWDASGTPQPTTSTSSGGGFLGTGIGSNFHWADFRDNLLAAGVVAGNYLLPGSSMLTGNLVTQGAQENLATDAGKLANIAAGAAGGIQGNTANYGKIGEAAGVTGGTSSLTAEQLAAANATSDPIAAANALKGWTIADIPYLQSIGATADLISLAEANNAKLLSPTGGGPAGGTVTPSTDTGTTNPLSNLTPTQAAQLAKAGISVAGLLAGGAAVKGITGGLTSGTGTGGMLTQQDRSGVSSGSAQYSPEYYQAIQAKYNQMMPAQPRDVTTDLKSWYETKYAPKVA